MYLSWFEWPPRRDGSVLVCRLRGRRRVELSTTGKSADDNNHPEPRNGHLCPHGPAWPGRHRCYGAGTTAATVIYVVVTDSAATFAGAPDITHSDARSYHAVLTVGERIACRCLFGQVGRVLCADAACTTVLGQTSVNYTITVTENPVLTGSWAPASLQLTAIQGDRQLFWPTVLSVPTSCSCLRACPMQRTS